MIDLKSSMVSNIFRAYINSNACITNLKGMSPKYRYGVLERRPLRKRNAQPGRSRKVLTGASMCDTCTYVALDVLSTILACLFDHFEITSLTAY